MLVISIKEKFVSTTIDPPVSTIFNISPLITRMVSIIHKRVRVIMLYELLEPGFLSYISSFKISVTFIFNGYIEMLVFHISVGNAESIFLSIISLKYKNNSQNIKL